MNNKVNIFEELNKMKNLIYAKSGVVISEQETIDTDVVSVHDEIIDNTGFLQNVDEKKIVDILKKYATDKNTFQNFLNKFKEKYKFDVTSIMAKSLDYSNDVVELNDLNAALSKIGLRYLNSGGIAKFEDLAVLRQKNINANYCSVKDGKVALPNTAYNGKEWKIYVSGNKVTEAEIAAAKATCPIVVVPPVDGTSTETLAPAGPTPAQRFTTTATSLGIQNPKMDVATLQTILNTLNQGGSGLTESKNLVNEELNKMKYMLGYQRGRVISEQDAAQPQPAATQPAATQPAATQPAATQPASTPKDLIRQIQTVLKTKYNANLGKFGAKGDGVDEKWGNLTQTALDNALKSMADLKQKRETETQQTNTQDAAIQQAATQQAATQPAATPKDLIRQIQTVLKTKYNANLCKFGAKGDGIDEKWGNLTQTALENALKSIADVKQRRETETQQTTTQDTAIQQASETGRMEIPQTNNLPNLPGIQQKQDIYTTLVNNKTLVTRPNGNIVYKGVDLTSTQRQELETKLKTMGYNLSTDNRDKTYGDKLIFKKNQ